MPASMYKMGGRKRRKRKREAKSNVSVQYWQTRAS